MRGCEQQSNAETCRLYTCTMRTITFLMALLLFANCKAQVENMERPVITPEFEKLNLEDYKEGLVKKKEIDGKKNVIEFDFYDYRKDGIEGVTFLTGSTALRGSAFHLQLKIPII